MHLSLLCGQLDYGGLERNVLQLAGGLPADVQVSIWSIVTTTFAQKVEQIDREIDVVPLPVPSFPRDGMAPLWLARQFRERSIDVVHTQDPKSRIRAHLAGRMAGIATVHTCHMSPLYYPGLSRARRAAYALGERAYRWATDAWVFVSDQERRLYEAERIAPPARALTIHNGTDLDQLAPATPEERASARRRFGVPDDAVLAVFTGRVDHQKGLDYLVAAAALAPAAGVQFLIVGAGPEQAELERLAETHAPGRFRFAGFQDAEGVHAALHAADLFVLPSRFECFPYSTLEALAAGLPCVVTDVGGNREAVDDGISGRVVPAGSPPALAEAIGPLASDAGLRRQMAQAARARAQQFSVERMVDRTDAVYRAVLAGQPLAQVDGAGTPESALRTSRPDT